MHFPHAAQNWQYQVQDPHLQGSDARLLFYSQVPFQQLKMPQLRATHLYNFILGNLLCIMLPFMKYPGQLIET